MSNFKIRNLFLALLLTQAASISWGLEKSFKTLKGACFNKGLACSEGECTPYLRFSTAFNSSTSTLRNAYKPSTRSKPQACTLGKDCTLCMNSKEDSCFTYPWKEDTSASSTAYFTSELSAELCFANKNGDLRNDIPDGLSSFCKDLSTAQKKLSLQVNCIADPTHPNCKNIMDKKIAERTADKKEYDDCMSLGYTKYNSKVAATKQRSSSCVYTLNEVTHDADKWRELFPSSCPGGFPNSDKKYCCTASDAVNACSQKCEAFYASSVVTPIPDPNPDPKPNPEPDPNTDPDPVENVNTPIFDAPNNGVKYSTNMQSMNVTCYMDGNSCPNGCDSHVVFKPDHNSSSSVRKNAYLAGTRFNPQACKDGQACTICFSSNAADCVTTIFRGSGPPVGRFDVTPGFLLRHCYSDDLLNLRSDMPAGIQSICKSVRKISTSYQTKINCIDNPTHPTCKSFMTEQEKKKNDDLSKYEECLRLGETKYNAGKSESEQRIYGCAYRKLSTKHGVNQTLWHDLMPGACPKDSFVSPNGLDCCSANEVVSACSGDCGVFFK